jgi:hypothetical protein
MADGMQGLFDYQSPQKLRNAYLDSMMISPTQMGSQGLLQQVVSMGQNAGSMIGAGVGGLLGGKVAGETESQYLDEAIKAGGAVKGTPTEKMKAVADYLADKPGMGAQYLKAVKEVRKMETEDLAMKRGEVGLATDVFNLDRAKVLAPIEAERAQLGVEIDKETLDKAKKINPSLIAQAELAVKRDEINLDVVRNNLEKAQFELKNEKDLAPDRKKLLENQVAMAEFTLGAAKAYEPVKLAEAQGRLDVLNRETNLAKALGALPDNATDAQIRATIRQNGGDPKIILQDITRVETARLAKEAKEEAARLAAEARRSVSDAKLAQMPKDVAEKVTANIALENGVARMDNLITKIDKGEVNFTVLDSLWAKANAMLGNFTPEGKLAADTKAEIKAQANLVLQNAKGVQTEGDAKRAYDLIINDLEKNSTAGVKSALSRLKAQQELTIKANKEYARRRGGIRDEDFNPAPTKPITDFDK